MATKTRSRKPPVPREAEVQRNAIVLLKSLGWPVWRRNVITVAIPAEGGRKRRFIRAGEASQADLWAVIPCGPNAGAHVELEIKRPGEWPTPAQVAWLRAMNGVGRSAAFWISDLGDLELVARHLMAGGHIEFANDDGQYRLVK